MNWFERYGIVGIYFVVLTGILLNIFHINNLFPDGNIAIALGAGVSLPIGYLISILSQIIYYYFLPEGLQVHKTACKEIDVLSNHNEIDLESKLAIRHRLHSNNFDIEHLKWLQEYIRKRWDVFAISSSMLIATIFAWILSIFILIIYKCSICFHFDWKFKSMFILSVMSCLILLRNRQLMFRQIVAVYEQLFKKLV